MSNPESSRTFTELVIINTRFLAVSRERVYALLENPAHLARWWGPKGFTNVFKTFDLRSGGTWRFTMRGPDGAEYEQDKRFTDVEKPARIVIRHTQPEHDFTLTMTLAEQDGGTLLTWRMVFDPSPHNNEQLRAFITRANEENLDRLADYLAATSA